MAYDNLQRLPDPTTVPAGPGFISQTLLNNSPGMLHPLNSGGTISVKFSGDYWTITLGYPQLTIQEGSTIFPFLYSLQGGFVNFYVQLPTRKQPVTGIWDTSTAAKIATGEMTKVSSTSISIPLWSSRGGDLSAGDFLKLTTGKKIYMVTGRSLNAGTMTLTLSSDIMSDIATAGLEPNDIKIRVRLKGNSPAEALSAEGLYEGFNIVLRENIR